MKKGMMRWVGAAAVGVLMAGPPALAAQQGTYAFEDVTVLTMDRSAVLHGQTVVVVNGVIAAMGPASRVRVPEGATRIDGAGRFLMPGLAEMHAHVPPQPDPPQEVLDDILFLYVANWARSTSCAWPGAWSPASSWDPPSTWAPPPSTGTAPPPPTQRSG